MPSAGVAEAVRCSNQVLRCIPSPASLPQIQETSTTDSLLPHLLSPVANISSRIASLYTTYLLDNLSYCVLAPAKAAWNGTEAAPTLLLPT